MPVEDEIPSRKQIGCKARSLGMLDQEGVATGCRLQGDSSDAPFGQVRGRPRTELEDLQLGTNQSVVAQAGYTPVLGEDLVGHQDPILPRP